MRTIAFDLTGNDNGVKSGIQAAVDFIQKNLDFTILLVGPKQEINKYLKDTERIKIIDKPAINMKKGALAARNDNNATSAAIHLVKRGEADAVISSADSGTYLSMTTLILRRIPGVKRPAFMPVVPTIEENKKFVLTDVGANLITTDEMLVQWAKMGSIFMKQNFKIKKPRVGIINIGTEKDKGFEFHQKAAETLKKCRGINYVGFVEPRELLNAVVDVAVVDGYAGNMILKTMEGTTLSLLKLLRKHLLSKFKYKLGALLSKGAFKNTKDQLDYRNVGSAWLIGINGLALKTHGSSDKQSYLGAFNQVKIVMENDTFKEFQKGIK